MEKEGQRKEIRKSIEGKEVKREKEKNRSGKRGKR